MPGPELVQALATGGVRYSRVWEDHLLLEQGLAIAPGDDVLSVTSAGCNVLNLLLKEPRSVTAVDLNPAQGALCELAVAAVRHLSRSEFVHFLGVRDGGDRLALYRRLRPALTPEARAFWDRSSDDVAAGVIHCGRLERYFRTFQTEHLAALIAPGTIDALLALEDPEEQRRLFEQRISGPELRRCFRWYFGREMMTRMGRHAMQFRQVAGIDVGAFFLERFTFACTRLPARGNFYLEFFLTSRYRNLAHAPPYLRPAGYERLRSLVDRLTVLTGDLETQLRTAPERSYNKVNLSDACEYLSPAEHERLLGALASRLRPGGRIVYWNLLVPHCRPAALADRLRSHTELARSLSRRDRAWFYRAFHIEEVLG